MAKVSDIISAIESAAPVYLQEDWDNTGLQVGHRDAEVTKVLVAVDVTPAIVEEAVRAGAQMVVSHHPLIFRGLKNITDANQVQRAVELAIKNDIAVYSSHTALDNAENGVSARMAVRLGARVERPLVPQGPDAPTGTGVVAVLPRPMAPQEFIALAKEAFGVKVARCTDPARCKHAIERVALCGGAGGGFIDDAVRAGADAYVTGDIRYHDFVDNASRILLVDCGHYETESLTKNLFYDIIRHKLPELSVIISDEEKNPVNYI